MQALPGASATDPGETKRRGCQHLSAGLKPSMRRTRFGRAAVWTALIAKNWPHISCRTGGRALKNYGAAVEREPQGNAMKTARIQHAPDYAVMDDFRLVELARNGEATAFRAIMKRHNRRLYRVARGVLGDDSEAEDVVQETYVKVFQSLAGFRGEASLTTWLTRIALNEALGRKRRRRPMLDLNDLDTMDEQREAQVLIFPGARLDTN